MDYSFDIGGLVGGILGAIPTLITVWLLSSQIKIEDKKDRVETVMKLFNDYFTNENFQSVFEIIDQDDVNKSKNEIEIILSGGEVNGIKETHLSQYFNYFNAIAILVREKIIDQHIVLEMFKYQLERTFSHLSLIQYVEDFGFNKVKILLPNGIFTYGTLSDPTFRKLNPELKGCAKYLGNGSAITLNGYNLEEVKSDKVYKALVHGEKICEVSGIIVRITDNSNLHELFTCLDHYEEVDSLYDRKIIWLPKNNSYAWVYMKKLN